MPVSLPNQIPSYLRIARIEESLASKYWEIIFHSSHPQPLITILERELPFIPPESWPERLQFGGTFLNGKEILTNCQVIPPSRIEYYQPKFDLQAASSYFPAFDPRWIIYQDSCLAVIFKPAGLSTVPVREQKQFNLKSYLEKYFNCSIHLPSRLDMATTGLVAVSINPAWHQRLQSIFEHHRAEKEYLLIAESPDFENSKTLTVNMPIGKDRTHAVLRAPDPLKGKNATTIFNFLAKIGDTALLSALPQTGRTHQIRVHAAYSGFPIVGDSFYNGRPADSLHLLSYRLKLPASACQNSKELELTCPKELIPQWIRCHVSRRCNGFTGGEWKATRV